MGDKAFILLCLINYGKRWLAEVVKAEKMIRKKWFVLVYQGSNQKLTYFVIVQNKKCVRGQMRRTTKAYR